MKEMKERTILDILEAITPDTSWLGEPDHDNKRLDNLTTLEDMIYQLYWQLTDDINYEGSASANAITKKKYFIVKMFYQVFRDAKVRIEKKMNVKLDDESMGKSEALRVAIDCISDRIAELCWEDIASQDYNEKRRACDESCSLFLARAILRDMLDKEGKKDE